MLQAYEGYFEDGKIFFLHAPLGIAKRRRVIITLLDEDVVDGEETSQAMALREFFETVNTDCEEIPETFERANFAQAVEL